MTPRQRVVAAVVLVVATCLAFAPGLTSPFTHYDDPLYVWNNLARLSVPGWEGLWLQFDSKRAWSGDFVEFFPLRDSVYWGLYQVFRLNPTPYHVTSLTFHLATSLLVWLFFVRLHIAERGAWLGALLFALHPVHIESVVWIAGMKDPMFSMFMVGGLCAYASYRERPATWKYVLMLAGMVCGFMVKSIVVAMPVIMLAMEVLVGQRARWSLIAARLFGPFAISGIFFAMILGVGKANATIVTPHGGNWSAHLVVTAWAQVKYLKQALLPTSYRLIYCFDPATSLLDWRFLVAIAVFLAVVALAFSFRREPLKLFMMAIYVLTIAPVSNLVPFPAVMADRYLYAPSIGVVGLLAMASLRLSEKFFRLVVFTILAVSAPSIAARVWIWQDEEALWEEPDRDPECVVDTDFPAAQSHILRYLTTKDRNEGLMALERAMVSPGLREVGPLLGCTTIIGATRDAQDLGGSERAVPWAKLSTRFCPTSPEAWNAAMVVSLHKNPALAAGAALKAWRLGRTPESEVLMWLTRLELGDLKAVPEVLRLAKLGQRQVCEKIAQFSNDVPTLHAQLGEANFECEAVLTRNDK
jgi:hypothetical protein